MIFKCQNVLRSIPMRWGYAPCCIPNEPEGGFRLANSDGTAPPEVMRWWIQQMNWLFFMHSMSADADMPYDVLHPEIRDRVYEELGL